MECRASIESRAFVDPPLLPGSAPSAPSHRTPVPARGQTILEIRHMLWAEIAAYSPSTLKPGRDDCSTCDDPSDSRTVIRSGSTGRGLFRHNRTFAGHSSRAGQLCACAPRGAYRSTDITTQRIGAKPRAIRLRRRRPWPDHAQKATGTARFAQPQSEWAT